MCNQQNESPLCPGTTGPHKYPPAGYCIYCGTTEGELSDEHIIPYSLNGTLILPKASCPACARITQKFEEICTHERWGMFAPLRSRLKMRSRSRWTLKNQVCAEVTYPDGRTESQKFVGDSFPAVAYGVRLPLAGILHGEQPTNKVQARIICRVAAPSVPLEFPQGSRLQVGSLRTLAFFRLLAKIGYSYAAAHMETSALNPLLADLILGKSDKYPHLIGGNGVYDDCTKIPDFHRLEMQDCTIDDTIFSLAVIHLFGPIGLPRYHVVVSQRCTDERRPKDVRRQS